MNKKLICIIIFLTFSIKIFSQFQIGSGIVIAYPAASYKNEINWGIGINLSTELLINKFIFGFEYQRIKFQSLISEKYINSAYLIKLGFYLRGFKIIPYISTGFGIYNKYFTLPFNEKYKVNAFCIIPEIGFYQKLFDSDNLFLKPFFGYNFAFFKKPSNYFLAGFKVNYRIQ